MSYCPYCGNEITSSMLYCPSCGAKLSAEERTYTNTGITASQSGDYAVYITDLGDCSRSDAADLLEDILGYTSSAALNLIYNIPVQIAANLSLSQAAVVAQAFEEYGVRLSVTNGDNYEDISKYTSSSSLFNSDGSFLSSAALILATLTAANRLRSIVRPKKPSLLEKLFHSLFNRKKRPVHMRRKITPRRHEPQRKVIRQHIRPAETRRPEVKQTRPAHTETEPAGGHAKPKGSHVGTGQHHAGSGKRK